MERTAVQTSRISTPVRPEGTRAGSARPADWRLGLPLLMGSVVTLREPRISDAPALQPLLSSAEVAKFISTPPPTVEVFGRFIEWAQRERAAGNYVCFAVVPAGMEHAVGIFQVRRLESSFQTAEWGFAIGSGFWNTGAFVDGAKLVLDFAFGVLGVHRLEARSAVANGRGNGALRKIGAVHEGILRKALLKDGRYLDQALWSILDDDWARGRDAIAARVH